MAILSTAQYKVYNPAIGINVDARLAVTIPAAERYFLMRIGNRDIESTEKEEYYDGDGTIELVLKRYPVVSITEFKIDDVVMVVDDYALYPESGIIKTKNGYSFTKNDFRNIYLKYFAGFASVPVEIQMAIAELTSRKIEAFDKEKGGSFTSESFSGGSVVFNESDETEYVKNVIDYYHKKGPKKAT